MKREFIRLVDHLKKRHELSHYRLAYILGVDRTTFSNHYHGYNGCKGDKYVQRLKELLDIVEPSIDVVSSMGNFYCTKCNNAHKYHPSKGECFS